MPNNILSVNNLCAGYGGNSIIKDVNLRISQGEIVGIVGESGSGKSTLANALTYFCDIYGGNMVFEGQNITKLNYRQKLEIRKKIQMIIQDSKTSFHPKNNVYKFLEEPLTNFTNMSRNERYKRCLELLDLVGLDKTFLNRYPNELSGGQRQRIAIARALSIDVKLLICDEITSALDVSVQKQIIDLLIKIQKRSNVSYIFISHDIALMSQICDRLAIMYHGKLVEEMRCDEINRAKHHHTRDLIKAMF
ncbi:MAG: ABC transporter ATP-binding protein [Aminipila sp.]